MKTISQPAWLDKTEYPFISRYFHYQQVLQHYIDVGKGETLLFVHGTPSWSFDFRNVIKPLSTSYRCIAIDHVGFGLSDKPVDYCYSTLQHAERLAAFIKHLDLKDITLILHDFGGPIGFHAALQQPERVKRFIIHNSWLWSSESDPNYQKLKRVLKSPLLPILYSHFNFSARYILPNSFGAKKLSSKIKKHFTKPLGSKRERQGTIAFAHSLLKDQSWFEELWTMTSVFATTPILFVWGMKDPVLKPAYLEKFTSAFKNPTVVELETCGHFPQEEEPEMVTTCIREFLQNN